MPGIAGIITKRSLYDAPKILDMMLQSMMHGTFYKKSTYMDQKIGWYVGGVAINGSYTDCMPIFNESRNIVIFLAGECLIDSQTVSLLRNKSHDIETSNASCLIHLYEEEGLDFINNLNGWFSGCILDSRTNKAFLFNDWYGMQKIYYHENEDSIYFASEAKALLRAVPKLREIDPKSIAEYLCFDCVLNEHSYFTDVYLLPGGSSWVFERGVIEKRSYFDPVQLESQSLLNKQSFIDELIGTFEHIMPRYFTGENIFISVTGGLDTRLILSCLPRDRRNIKALTFGGMYRDCQDLIIGKEISKACNIEHHTICYDKDFLFDYPIHVERAVYITDGLADATWAGQPYLNERARFVAPIKLTGVYGSQVLGRVRAALRNRLPDPELIDPEFMHYLTDNAEALMPFKQENKLSYFLKRELPWYWSKAIVPQLSQLTVRSPFLDKDFIKMLYRAPTEGFDGSDFELHGIMKNSRGLMDIRTNRGVGGTEPPLISKIMHTINTLRAIGEKTLNWDILPYSLHHFVTKMDTLVLSPLHLNKFFLGFEYYQHYNMWFRSELASYIKEILLDDRTLKRPYWNAKHLNRIVNDHVKGRGRYLSEIRKVLTIELIHRLLVENNQ